MNRRSMLRSVAIASAATAVTPGLFAQKKDSPRHAALLRFLERHAREDGGYGWADQEHSHLTPTFAVIGCYRALGRTPPNPAAVAEFVRAHHPGALKKLEQERRSFDYQQVQALAWLGADVSGFRQKFASWKAPVAYLKQYEQHGFPLFSSEMGVFLGRSLIGFAPAELPAAFLDYLNSRQRLNGTFNNTPASDGTDGHVLSTWWALQALRALGRSSGHKEELIAWLQECQRPSGGFTFAPRPEFGGIDDVAYTWAAVRALRELGAKPTRSCVTYLRSLADGDGGFADRPRWMSNPLATYYAVDALAAIGAFEEVVPARAARPRRTALPSNLKVFSIQLEAHGHGSPAEAVDLAGALRIHLWGAKNAKPEWIARAQSLSRAQRVPVTFFTSNEEYGTWVNVPGLGTYSHTSDVIAPARAEIGESLAKAGAVTWAEFRDQRLAPLQKAQGRLIWQFGENEELVRMFLDDSVERGGFAAISTFHFGNPDFTNSEPFLQRWRGQLPFVALQDAHGPEPWWFADMTTGFRTLFLATEPTWDAWLRALKNHWVVAVRRDQWTAGKTWMHASSREVLEFARAQEPQWRWWNNAEIQRPMVSVVAVRPDDEFEAARPERGITLRIRCAWENTPQGLLKQPLSELIGVTVDGLAVDPKLVVRKRPNGLYDEHAHHVVMPDIKAGRHIVRATVRVIATGAELSRTLEFNSPAA